MVVDGQQINISYGGDLTPIGGIASGRSQDGRIDLNTANAKLLEELPGIGEVRAKSIIEWRSTHGSFSSADDLMAISGIGESIIESLRPLVTP